MKPNWWKLALGAATFLAVTILLDYLQGLNK